MDPSLQLVFDEIRKRFDEIDARWEQRFAGTRAAHEQPDFAEIHAPVAADNWGGQFEQPAQTMGAECDLDVSASTARVAYRDLPAPIQAASVGADVGADNWGGHFDAVPISLHQPVPAPDATSTGSDTPPFASVLDSAFNSEFAASDKELEVVDVDEKRGREFLVGDLSARRPLRRLRCSPLRPSRLRLQWRATPRPPWLRRPWQASPRRVGRPPRLPVRSYRPRLRARVLLLQLGALHHLVRAPWRWRDLRRPRRARALAMRGLRRQGRREPPPRQPLVASPPSPSHNAATGFVGRSSNSAGRMHSALGVQPPPCTDLVAAGDAADVATAPAPLSVVLNTSLADALVCTSTPTTARYCPFHSLLPTKCSLYCQSGLVVLSCSAFEVYDSHKVFEGLFSQSPVQLTQIWPPSEQLGLQDNGVPLRPAPWPSLTMVEKYAVRCSSGRFWKPPWPIHQQIEHIEHMANICAVDSPCCVEATSIMMTDSLCEAMSVSPRQVCYTLISMRGVKCCALVVRGRTSIESWNFNVAALSVFLASLPIAAHTEVSHENIVGHFLKQYVIFSTSTSSDVSRTMSLFFYSHCHTSRMYAASTDVFLASLLVLLSPKQLQFSWDPGVSQEAICSCIFLILRAPLQRIMVLVYLPGPRTLHSYSCDLLLILPAIGALHHESSDGPFCMFLLDQHQDDRHVLCNHDVTSNS